MRMHKYKDYCMQLLLRGWCKGWARVDGVRIERAWCTVGVVEWSSTGSVSLYIELELEQISDIRNGWSSPCGQGHVEPSSKSSRMCSPWSRNMFPDIYKITSMHKTSIKYKLKSKQVIFDSYIKWLQLYSNL